MTTTQSPTTAPRQLRHAADQTTEKVEQGALEVTERADRHPPTERTDEDNERVIDTK